MSEGMFGKGFWIAMAVSFAIIIAWDHFFLKDIREAEQLNNSKSVVSSSSTDSSVNINNTANGNLLLREQALNTTQRVSFNNGSINGSISLKGARIDDVSLTHYKESVDKNSKNVQLFDLKDTQNAYFFETGWLTSQNIVLPNQDTLWSTNKKTLSVDSPVIFSWTNPQGILFTKEISIDDSYVITVEDKIINKTAQAIDITPYAFILRYNDPKVEDLFISHEGFVGYLGKSLERIDYNDTLAKNYEFNSKGGFAGFTDKYWLASLLLDPEQQANVRFLSFKDTSGVNNYQADYKGSNLKVEPSRTIANKSHIFVGPKEYKVLDHYNDTYKLNKFEDTIDFGWFFFFTKPMIQFLLWLYSLLGYFGSAIILFTIIIRAIILPIAYKSYISMAKLRVLQPKMKELKELYGSDMKKYNSELMGLYKKEQVNPLSGCLPLLLQIPIFFSIYKVIFISIEMRQAPFWGWIHDMSAMDPTNLFTLFGMIPWEAPSFLHIGIWPILMGITMFIQQKLSMTQQMDSMQQRVMNIMPVVLIVVLAAFPAGLVIYWTWSNIISIGQQFIINAKVNKLIPNYKK